MKKSSKNGTPYPVVLESDATGGYVVSCPSFDGCYSQGDTVEEAMKNIREAILLCEVDALKKSFRVREVSLHLVTV